MGRRSKTKEEIKEIAQQFSSRKEFRENALSTYQLASKKGILEEVCKGMTAGWSLQTLKEAGSIYSSPTEFKKGNGGAYETARKLGYLSKIKYKKN